MTRIRVASFSVSMDGFAAGPEQSLQDPMGRGGMALHQWAFATRTFRTMFGQEGGDTDEGDAYAARSFENLGAWVLGRHMFGPVRGPWGDSDWKGWWGDTPPYRVPVFVLTHHARAPIEMDGGTTFHFVTDGLESALAQARTAAKGRDVRIGGGAATVRAAVRERLVDEMHLVLSPVLLGQGEPLFQGLDLPALGYRVEEQSPTRLATHVVLRRHD